MYAKIREAHEARVLKRDQKLGRAPAPAKGRGPESTKGQRGQRDSRSQLSLKKIWKPSIKFTAKKMVQY